MERYNYSRHGRNERLMLFCVWLCASSFSDAWTMVWYGMVWYGMVWYGVYSFNISVHFYIAHITQDAEREMHEV